MKKYTLILSLLFLLISTNVFGATSILGYWLTGGSIVQIEKCNDYVCGKIKTIFVEEGVDPKQLLDDKNKDKSLRSRTLVGINILDNFLIEDINQRTFKGGKIYDPRSGRTYKSNLYINDNGTLSVEGCLAFICNGEEWKPLEVTINADGTSEAVLKNSL